jgi:hypothetical protein
MSLEAIAPLSDNSTVSLPAIAAWHGGPTRQGAALLHYSLGHDPVRNRRPHVQLVSCYRPVASNYACAQAAATSRVARTGSFRTLQSAFKFSARGRVRPISQKYTQGAVTPTCEATSATDRCRARRALRRCWLKLTLRGKAKTPVCFPIPDVGTTRKIDSPVHYGKPSG